MSSTTKKILITIEIVLLIIGIITSVSMMVSGFSDVGSMVAAGSEIAPVEGQKAEGEIPGQAGPDMIPTAGSLSFIINHILPFIMYLLIAYYMFIGYKKPHGNVLRFTMLSFAICLALVVASTKGKGFACSYPLPIASALIAYISGRLNKIKKNTVLVIIVAVLLAGFAITELVRGGRISFVGIFSTALFFIIWLLIVNAYIARYKEHKEAGLTDSADK